MNTHVFHPNGFPLVILKTMKQKSQYDCANTYDKNFSDFQCLKERGG